MILNIFDDIDDNYLEKKTTKIRITWLRNKKKKREQRPSLQIKNKEQDEKEIAPPSHTEEKGGARSQLDGGASLRSNQH